MKACLEQFPVHCLTWVQREMPTSAGFIWRSRAVLSSSHAQVPCSVPRHGKRQSSSISTRTALSSAKCKPTFKPEFLWPTGEEGDRYNYLAQQVTACLPAAQIYEPINRSWWIFCHLWSVLLFLCKSTIALNNLSGVLQLELLKGSALSCKGGVLQSVEMHWCAGAFFSIAV